MKKYVFVVFCLTFAVLFLTACTVKKQQQTINYQRKITQYMPKDMKGSQAVQGSTIDLSEGPKLNYNTNLGPGDVNFEFKIVNPY